MLYENSTFFFMKYICKSCFLLFFTEKDRLELNFIWAVTLRALVHSTIPRGVWYYPWVVQNPQRNSGFDQPPGGRGSGRQNFDLQALDDVYLTCCYNDAKINACK